MKPIYKKILKFLPLLVLLFVILAPCDVFADHSIADGANKLVSWAKNAYDKANEFGQKALDMAKNCVGDVGACASKIKDKMKDLALKALDLLIRDNCVLKTVHSECVFCGMFKTLFNAAAMVASVSYAAFSGSLGVLILVFLAVSLALIVLKNLASFGSKDTGGMLNDVFSRAFVCVGIYIIITQDYFNLFNMTIGAVISDGLSLVSHINGGSSGDGVAGYAAAAGANGGQVMPSSIEMQIDDAIRRIEAKIYQLFNYGDYAWCLGTGPKKIFKIFWHLTYMIDAIFLYVGGLFFMVGYPWVMADAVLQLGIALALLPFAVAGYAFGGTRKYLPKTFSWMLHSIFVFIFMSILIECVLTYVGQILDAAFSSAGDRLFVDAQKGVVFYGSNMMKILFILAIGWNYMPEIRELAQNFAQGSGLSAGAKVGETVGKQMEKGLEKTAKYTGEKAWEGTKAAGRVGLRTAKGINRRGGMFLAKHFGHTEADGSRVWTLGGELARRNKFVRFLTRGKEFRIENNTAGNIRDAQGNKIGNTGLQRKLAMDGSGNVIGYVDENNHVIKADGTDMGALDRNNEIVDSSGNTLASARGNHERRMIFDSAGNIVGYVHQETDANGRLIETKEVRDLNGNVIGSLDDNGNALDASGRSVGSIFKTGEAAVDAQGNVIGSINASGQVLDERGNVVGRVNAATGEIMADEVIEADKIEKEALDASGALLGFVDSTGVLRDADGNVIAHEDGSGNLLDAHGNIIGVARNRVVRNEDGSVKYNIDASGQVLDAGGNVIGSIDPATGNLIMSDRIIGRTMNNVKFAYDDLGNPIGHILNDGTVKDFHGNVLGGAAVKTGLSDVLVKEHISITGRRHVNRYDKYSSVKQEFDRSGNLIKNEAKFHHNFLKKYLIDEKGEINQGALQKLMDSAMAQDPNMRKVLLNQVGKEILKKQGHSVSKYFHQGQGMLDYQESKTIGVARGDKAYDLLGHELGTIKNNRIFDSSGQVVGSIDANGNAVSDARMTIKQVNHSGERLTYGLAIDSLTGQVCTQFARDAKKTHVMRRLGREAAINLHRGGMHTLNSMFGRGYYTLRGTEAFDTLLGTHYETGSDAKGNYYIRDRKKYFFFGPRETKKVYATETQRAVDKNRSRNIHNADKIRSILAGRTEAKGLFFKYEAAVDVNTGEKVYRRYLRKGWNVKNYVRWPIQTAKVALKTTSKVVVKTTTNTLTAGAATIAFPAIWATSLLINPKKTLNGELTENFVKRRWRNFKKDLDGTIDDFKHLSDSWQTGNIQEYTDEGKKVIDSSTGRTIKSDFDHTVSTERIDDSKTVTNANNPNDTTLFGGRDTTQREVHFNNGMVEIKVKATVASDGSVQYEETKVIYSARAQKGHDSFLDNGNDDYQIVSETGTIASDLQAENTDSFYLDFGMNNFCGATSIGGMSARDFIVKDLLARVRKSKSNKHHTDFTKEIF